MSGINYTVFVNPSGVARNIFILSSTEAGVTGQKVSAETKSVGPFELLARRAARENSSATNFYRVPSCSKRTRPRRREKVLPDYLPEEQAIQLPRVPYYVVSTWDWERERERETRHSPRHHLGSPNNFTSRASISDSNEIQQREETFWIVTASIFLRLTVRRIISI